MQLLDTEPLVTALVAAVKVPHGLGTRVHSDRPSHGLALYYGGSCLFTFADGTQLTAREGDCVFLPRHSSYTVDYLTDTPPEEGGCYAINFLLLEDLPPTPWLLHCKNRGQLLRRFEAVLRLRLSKTPGSRQQALSELYAILAALKEQYARPYASSRTARLLQPALEHIQSHFHEPIAMDTLAGLCGISQSYLRKLFGQALGCSPVEYIRQLRLSYARQLLRSGEYTVAAAAEQAGFPEPAYFSRAFRALYHCAPSSLLHTD